MKPSQFQRDIFWLVVSILCGYLLVRFATPLWDFLGVNPK